MKNRVIWIFIASEKAGSSRIHGYNIHNKLLELGYNSFILFQPNEWLDKYIWDGLENKLAKALNKNDVLIVQKIKDQKYINLFDILRRKGVTIVFIDSDLPLASFYKNSVDLVICPSNYLKQIYKDAGFNYVVKLEDSPELYLYNRNKSFTKSCVWFGQSSGNKWQSVLYLEKLFEHQITGWKLKTISNTDKADILWDKNSYKKIASFDAVLIPIINSGKSENQVKSANRILQSMALGVPVLAQPIPSYESIIEHGQNGYLVNDETEWMQALTNLEDNQKREKIRHNGFTLAKKYCLDNYIEKWVETLNIEKKNDIENNKVERIKCIAYKKLKNRNNYYRNEYLKTEGNLVKRYLFKLEYRIIAVYQKLIRI